MVINETGQGDPKNISKLPLCSLAVSSRSFYKASIGLQSADWVLANCSVFGSLRMPHSEVRNRLWGNQNDEKPFMFSNYGWSSFNHGGPTITAAYSNFQPSNMGSMSCTLDRRCVILRNGSLGREALSQGWLIAFHFCAVALRHLLCYRSVKSGQQAKVSVLWWLGCITEKQKQKNIKKTSKT